MANPPNPRSYSQILGSMVNSFLSRLGLPSIKNGDPSLSIMEAAAQSDFRSSQDLLRTLSIRNLNAQTAATLDATGREERVYRISESPSSGLVDFSDTGVTKHQTAIYQSGTGVPAGSTTILIEDGTGFPAPSGQVFIGRGTLSQEGPLAYTSLVQGPNYWTMTLSLGTVNYHQLGESVTLAQGGDRFIPAGTIVSTPVSSAGGQIQFRTLFDATIPSGESEILSVPVESTTAGSSTNVGVGLISAVVSPPFPTCSVTNPAPFSNGRDTEDDDSYRDRIRLARKSRSKATGSSIVNALLGARSPDESGQITSVSTTFRAGEPRTIYIDDGTGYQEKDSGVAKEVIVGSALGGERYFSLQNRPVAKAYVKSATFPLVATSLNLSVRTASGIHLHTLSGFKTVNSVSAYEVASSINSDFRIPFAARVVDYGKAVALYSKNESDEWIEVLDGGANDWLVFSTIPAYTLYLYRNDTLLSEDGQPASVQTRSYGTWSDISDGATLTVRIDGVQQAITVNNIDFVSAQTGYVSVNKSNGLQAWAKVLSLKIAGMTATVLGDKLVLTSNAGRVPSASIEIESGTIATAMFSAIPVSAVGLASEYTFDRNSSQIKLAEPLETGDSLTAGSEWTRGFLEGLVNPLPISTDPTSVAPQAGAEFWIAIDGNVTFPEPSVPVGIGTSLVWTAGTVTSWGRRDRISISGNPAAWSEMLPGDWIIINDSGVADDQKGLYQIAEVDPSFVYVEIERRAGGTTGTFPLSEGGFVVVRSTTRPQRVFVDSLLYASCTSTTLASIFNNSLAGATASVYSNGKLRVATNTLGGQIAVVATNPAGASLFGQKLVADSSNPHTSSVVSQNSDTEILSFPAGRNTVSVSGGTETTLKAVAAYHPRSYITAKFGTPVSDAPDEDRISASKLYQTIRAFALPNDFTVAPGLELNTVGTGGWLAGNAFQMGRGYDLTARDTLSFMMDGDNVGGRYAANMFRRAKIVSFSGSDLTLSEIDNSSLATSFGSSFDWRDFLISFKSRVKSDDLTNKMVLWRWWRHGPEGNVARVQYGYPDAASQSTVTVSVAEGKDVTVKLGSGTALATPQIRSTTRIGMAVTSGPTAGLYTYQFVLNFAVSATRVSGVTTLTLTLPGGVTDHGIGTGQIVFVKSSNPNFLSGPKRVESVTTNTLTYIDVGVDAGPAALDSVSCDSVGEAAASGGGVATGSVFSGVNAAGFGADFKKSFKITLSAGSNSWTANHPMASGVNTVLVWAPAFGSVFFPLTSKTVAQIATEVNQIPNCAVTASAIGLAGNTSGVVQDATYETSGTYPWWDLSDGFNWVSSTSTATHVTFSLRNAPTANLTADADLASEDVRIVPVTAASVARWLNSPAVSGLSARGGAYVTESGKVQIESETVGSSSSVQVLGGTANSAGTAVRGTATLTSDSDIFVTTDRNDGVGGGQHVWVQNAIKNKKSVFTSAHTLQSINPDTGLVTLTPAAAAWQIIEQENGAGLQIEKEGALVAVRDAMAILPTLGSVKEGDFLWMRQSTVGPPPAGFVAISPYNVGFFRIVKKSNDTIWIENPHVVEQLAYASWTVIDHNSTLPGDTVTFGDSTWGAGNVGSRRVVTLGSTEYEFVLDTSTLPLSAGINAPLGSSSSLFQVEAAEPFRVLKEVLCISPNGDSAMDMSLRVSDGYTLISEALGTSLIPANKLQFGTSATSAVDAYRYNTGLIGEASRIVFGDESNALEYEGVASAGASYNISGPIVKQVFVSLSVRASGDFDSLRQQIQSAAASVINRSAVGESIAFSEIIAEVERVTEVLSVSVLSPSYTSTNDRILVQPYEKALVTNVASDISVTFVGE